MDDKFDNVTLIDEEGEEFEFEVVDFFLLDEQEYAVLLPLDSETSDANIDSGKTNGSNNDEEAIIMRVLQGNDGETTLQVIDNEVEWQKVADIALERLLEQEE